MAKNKLTDFSLPADAYLAFDAVSLKELIKERLNTKSFFTDQNFEGSNLSAIMDIIAYSYHVLLFYLNQTSTESIFSEAELYENMNRIVKLIDYKPIGYQTSNLSFQSTADSALPKNTYTVSRYSFVDVAGVPYSFIDDITFTKLTDGTETLTELGEQNLLYQGRFEEYPIMTAIGEDFEVVTLLPGDDVIIDHFNIEVYVRDVITKTWSQWNRVPSLFLQTSTTKGFEARLNENKRYELKFGNNVTGKRLATGDQIAVYYLKSEGKDGEVGIGAINGSSCVSLTTPQFVEIFDDVKDQYINYITAAQASLVSFSNTAASTEYAAGETVDDMRERAPSIFSSQYRLVTKEDYEAYITQHYSNIIKDVKVVNNWDYLDGHLKYITETLDLATANTDANTLYNQVTFADSCDFNNVYVYAIPKLEKPTTAVIRTNYLSPAQKTSIIESIRDTKVLTTETIIMDPVYIAVDIGAYVSPETLSSTLKDKTKLQLIRRENSTKSFDSIKSSAYTIVVDYFKAFKLGGTIDITNLINSLLSIDDVKQIKTVRTDISLEIDGLNLLLWNPIYPDLDISTINSNIHLEHFKYPYLNDPAGFLDKIEVVADSTSSGLVEF